MECAVPKISTLKEQGNEALSKNAFREAIKFYTDAITMDDTNYIIYSNRSAAYCRLGEYEKALKDAEKTIELKPDWAKGYSRKASALAYLDRLSEAITFYEEAISRDPANAQLQEDLADVKRRKAESCGLPPGMPNPFASPDLFPKLLADPQTKEYLNDPKFVQTLQKIRDDKEAMTMNLHDPRVLQCLGVLLGFKTVGEKDETMHVDPQVPEPAPERPKPEDGMPANKRVALEKKIKGNEFYKKRFFDLAMQEYLDASKLDPTDITFLLNMAAIYFEQKDYDLCIDECEKAISIGRENRADFKLIAKAFTRIGNAYKKKGNLKMAKSSYEKAMAEHRTPEIKTLISEVEQKIKEEERKAYIDPVKAEEEKEKGNQKFKEGDYPGAVKHYSEAILRNPDEAKYYSNRAACYTKLGAFDLGLKDCDKCVELDPKFVRGWIRKGKILQGMHQHPKALKCYQTALSLDPNSTEAAEGYRTCSMFYDSNPEEVRKRAMADPEVQAILRDPAMRLILEQMQNDPKALQDHLKNPAIAEKLQKLLESGLIAIH